MPNENTCDRLSHYRQNASRIDELLAENERLAEQIAEDLHELVSGYQTVAFDEKKTTIEDYRPELLAATGTKGTSAYSPAAELAQVIEDEDEVYASLEHARPKLRLEDDAVVVFMPPSLRDDEGVECRIPARLLSMTKDEFADYVMQSLAIAKRQADADRQAKRDAEERRELQEWRRLERKFGGGHG